MAAARTLGRPRSTMTPEVEERILDRIERSMRPRTAAEAEGIAHSTLSSHKARNPDFAARIVQKEGVCQNRLLGLVEKAATSGNWTAAAWLLERRWPAEYCRPELRAQLNSSAVSASEIVVGITAALGIVAQRHMPPGAPDADDLVDVPSIGHDDETPHSGNVGSVSRA